MVPTTLPELRSAAERVLADAGPLLRNEWEGGMPPPHALAAAAVLATGAALLAHLAVSLLVSLYHFARIKLALRGMPVAPCWLPVLGHSITLFNSVGKFPCTWDLFSDWARATAPRPVRVQIFNRECVLIACPKMVKQVFQTQIKKYAKDLSFAYAPFMDILGTGLVTSEGATWKHQRLLVSAAFRVEILDDIVDISRRAAARLADKLDKLRGTGKTAEMSEEFRHLTLQVIGEAILSLTPEEADEVFPHLYLPVMEEFNRRSLAPWRTYLPLPEWVRTKVRMRQLDRYVIGLIRKRWAGRKARKAAGEADIMDRIMDAVGEERWGPAAERQLCYEIKTFVLAGHETSASMLTWALHELVSAPEKMERLRAEGRPVFGDCRGKGGLPAANPSRAALDTLEYTVGALKEALRKYSVVPVVTRECVQDDVLGGCAVPRGTTVIIVMQGVHHREDIWPEPMEFKPERFMQGEGGGPPSHDRFDFLPFIEGPRNCLGQHLALLEARIVLQLLVQRFDFVAESAENGIRHPGVIPIAPWKGCHMSVH